MKLSERLYDLRKSSRLSQEKIAEELGVSRQSVSLWETGQSIPSIENLILLSKIFKVSLDQLVGLVSLDNEILTSIDSLLQVNYAETKESALLTNQYFFSGWNYILPGTMVILIIEFIRASIHYKNNLGFILAALFFLLLVGVLILIPYSINKQIKKILNKKATIKLVFHSEYIHLEKKGIETDTAYDIKYSNIIQMVEKERYFLLVLKRNRAVYVPKQENSEALSEHLSKQVRKVYVQTHAYYLSKPFLYKLLCLFMPLFSIVSVGFTMALFNNPDDLPLWFIFMIFPVVSFLTGLFGRKYVAIPLWIFSLIFGVITILFQLMGLIAIMNT